jgi:Uma2 family endonuclease
MASVPRRVPEKGDPVQLHNGDRMLREEFHRAYCGMPDDYRAELIGGIVFEPSPLGYAHGENDVRLSFLFELYSIETPGTGVAGNATVMLSEEDEVQPDLLLRITEELGGRSPVTSDGYLKGAPELVAEVAHSSRAIDLHLKKERYARAGVLEYIVMCLKPKQIYWFHFAGKAELEAGRDGVFRSVVFPGLWIHGHGLLHGKRKLTLNTLNRGLQSPEHRTFVSELAKRRR